MTAPLDHRRLHGWYVLQKRDLPWRLNRDPYRIWISETMLQQTTTAAVIPFYEKFLKRFPRLQTLAEAPVEDVLESWAGLGYYSRARNLHKAAQRLYELGGFPRTHQELLALPGFGPYTARAVASLAFDERVGVLDGNVIRVLSRKFALNTAWWTTAARRELQEKSDEMAAHLPSHEMNQALMELGATVCLPQNPKCFLCPWFDSCEARIQGRVAEIPRKRPQPEKEIWQWMPHVLTRRGQIAIVRNDYAPFLKGQWLLPGRVRRLKAKPKSFDFRHTVTRFEIYVKLDRSADVKSKAESRLTWVPVRDLARWIPASLVHKALEKE